MSAFWLTAIFLVQSLSTGQVPPGAVSGRLLSSKGGPAAGVRIAAVPAVEGNTAASPVLVGISQTDADGRYQLDGIPPGRYYIFAGLIDFPSYYPNATSLERATAIVIEAGTTLSGIDFSMARPLGLTVAGRLAIPSTMQVVTGWSVSLMPVGRGATTDSQQIAVRPDGTFEFLRVFPGGYRVSANVQGSTPIPVDVTDTDVLNLVIPVVDCNAGVKVSGKLTGTLITPVRTVSLTGSSVGCAPVTSVETDGSFAFNNVPEGIYQYRITPTPLGWSSATVNVGKADLTGIEVALPTLITLKGRASVEDGSALPRSSRGLPMEIVARTSGGQASTTVLDDGTFELLLPRGRYSLLVPAAPTGTYVKSIAYGSTNLSTSDLSLTEDPAKEIELTLGFIRPAKPSGVRVSGQLTFPPAGDFRKSEGVLLVSARRKNDPIYESVLAADGSFEFSGIPPGTYNLETYPDNPAALYGIVVGRTDVTGIEFALPVLVNVKGGIEWSDSAKARNNLSVQFTRKEGNRVLAWGALVQSGAFHFYLPEGDYRFSISDLPPDFDVGSVTFGEVNILEDGLSVRADAKSPNLRVILRGK